MLEFDINRIQYLSIAGSLALLLFIVYLIRNKRIRVEYSLVWLFWGVFFLFFSIWREGLELLSRAMGISYAPAALFLIMISGVFLLLIQFSVIISRISRENRILTQEIALLRARVVRVSGAGPGAGPDDEGEE
jgi:hypothetical protein